MAITKFDDDTSREKISAFFAKKRQLKKKKSTGGFTLQYVLESTRTTDAPPPPPSASSSSSSSAVPATTTATTTTTDVRSTSGSEMLKQQEGWIELDNEKKQVIQTAGKTLTSLEDLTLNDEEGTDDDKTQEEAMNEFKWRMSNKKAKEPVEQREQPKTWGERQRRLREEKEIQLDSEKQFPTLGGPDRSSAAAGSGGRKTKQAQAISTSNVWSRFRADSDSEDEAQKNATPKAAQSDGVDLRKPDDRAKDNGDGDGDGDDNGNADADADAAVADQAGFSRFSGLKKKKKKPSA